MMQESVPLEIPRVKYRRHPWFWILLLNLCGLLADGLRQPFFALAETMLSQEHCFSMENFYYLYLENNRYLLLFTLFLGLILLISVPAEGFNYKATRGQRMFGVAATVFTLIFSLIVWMPSSGALREATSRTICALHQKQLFHALQQYADDFDNAYPPDLDTLAANEYIPQENELLKCPHASDRSGYLYFGKERNKTEPPFLLLKDLPGNHPGHFENRQFSDGASQGGMASLIRQ